MGSSVNKFSHSQLAMASGWDQRVGSSNCATSRQPLPLGCLNTIVCPGVPLMEQYLQDVLKRIRKIVSDINA